jgi:hypothetical protein
MMSLAPRNRAEQNRIEKASKSFFRFKAWEVEDFAKGSGQFVVKTDQIRLFVSCHDSDGQKFFSNLAIMDALAEKAYRVKVNLHIPTAFVFSSHLVGTAPDVAAKRGLHLFTCDELVLVTELQRFNTELPSDQSLTERQKGVLYQQRSLCSSIVERFRATGDLAAAVVWARYAADGADGYTRAYETLLGLLLEVGDETAAASLCERVLDKFPNNLLFLCSMQKLSAKLKIDQHGEDWEVRIAKVRRSIVLSEEKSISLETILQKQAAARPCRGRVAPVPSSTDTNGLGIVELVRRMFIRSS